MSEAFESDVTPNGAAVGFSTDAAARACLTRFGWKRLLLSRLFEGLFRPLVLLGDSRRSEVEGDPRTILVVEYWNLGDLAMLTPFLKNLRLHYPLARIALLANPRVAPLLEGQGLVDEVILVKVPWAQHMSRWKKYVSRHWLAFLGCLRVVRSRRFDLGFSGRADVRDNFLMWVTRVRRRVGYGFGYGGSFLTDIVSADLTRPHQSDRWLRLLEHLGKPVIDGRSELKVLPEERQAARRLLAELGIAQSEMLVGVHPGARNPVRQWGEHNFLEVAARLSASFPLKILWFHEPGSPAPPSRQGIIPIALPLREFLAVASQCRLFVCNDTGPMHLAAAVGAPVVAVFGPTMAAWFGPRAAGSTVVAHDGVWCRPCFDYCIFDQAYCLRAVSVDAVFAAAAEAVSTMVGSRSVPRARRDDQPTHSIRVTPRREEQH
jgi:heptosyltransferase II